MKSTKEEWRECLSCHELKPISRFFTRSEDSLCRRCQIGLFYQQSIKKLSEQSVKHFGYIYLFYSPLMGLYKIGRSIDPSKRMESLSIPDVELRYAFLSDSMDVHEWLLHSIYSPQRVGREWFKLNDWHVEELKQIAKKIGKGQVRTTFAFDWALYLNKAKSAYEAEIAEERRRVAEVKRAADKVWREQELIRLGRVRCPACLRLAQRKDRYQTFCSKGCRGKFQQGRRLFHEFMNDPDNLIIPIIDAYRAARHWSDPITLEYKYKFDEAYTRLKILEIAKAELDELAEQAYYLMSKEP